MAHYIQNPRRFAQKFIIKDSSRPSNTTETKRTSTQGVHGDCRVRDAVGVAILLQGLGLPAGAVLVVGVVLHVLGAEPLGFVDEGALLGLRQEFPFSSCSYRREKCMSYYCSVKCVHSYIA